MTNLVVIKGDITKVFADAIVNAANSSLMGGGGVDGAIHRAGGPAILEDCRKIVARQGGCKTGEAVVTSAGWLHAKFVIHTVGPVWSDDQREKNDKLLANCYRNSLQLAVEKSCLSVAFPNISTGVYHYPKARAAAIAVAAVQEFIHSNDTIKEVFFVCYDEENFELMKELTGQ